MERPPVWHLMQAINFAALMCELEHSLRKYLTKYMEEECRWESDSCLASQ